MLELVIFSESKLHGYRRSVNQSTSLKVEQVSFK